MSVGVQIVLGMYCTSQVLYLLFAGMFLDLEFNVEYENKNVYYRWSFIWIEIYKSNKLNRVGKIFLETVYSIFFLPAILLGFIIIGSFAGARFIFNKLFVKKENER